MSYHAYGDDMTASRGGPTTEYGTGVNYSVPGPGSSASSSDTEESTDQASSTPAPAPSGGVPYYGGAQAPQAASAGLSTMTLAVMASVGLAGYWLYTRLG